MLPEVWKTILHVGGCYRSTELEVVCIVCGGEKASLLAWIQHSTASYGDQLGPLGVRCEFFLGL